MKKEFIFVGPPGSGKGTQTKMLSEELGLPHIDTGALLREEIASNSEKGRLAASFIDKGNLVPLELVAGIIKNRLMKKDCEKGFILDGYPRNMEQALALDDILKEVNKKDDIKPQVFYFEVNQEKLIERLVNRRSCPKCGAIYNLKTMKLKDETKCEQCGSTLSRRADDTEEVAKQRFKTYFEQTFPIIDMYKKRGWLNNIDASLDIDTIYKNLKGAVDKWQYAENPSMK